MNNLNDFIIENDVLELYRGRDIHVVVPDDIKVIGNYAFQRNDDIVSVQLPEGVTEIRDNAFKGCVSLREINIPASIKNIGAEAFRNCRSLDGIKFSGEPKKIGVLAFYGCWKLAYNMQSLIPSVQDFLIRMREGNIFIDEAKKIYKLTKTKDTVAIKEFEGVSMVDGGPNKYLYKFSNKEKSLIIPKLVGGLPVVKAPYKMVPEDAVIYCSEEHFDKLSRFNKAIIAMQWLVEDKMLKEELKDKIQGFIKKYPDDVAYELVKYSDAAVYQHFIDIAKPKAKLIETLIEQCKGNTAVIALLLEYNNLCSQKEMELTLDDSMPKFTVAELKKLWTYQTYTIESTGEKCIELTNYKGRNKQVIIPSHIGKIRVDTVKGIFPLETETVVFPNEEIKIECSFCNCKAMADKDGFIYVYAGTRCVLTDYIGPKDVEVLRIPECVTENTFGTFMEMNIREVIIPEGFKNLARASFSYCRNLKKVYLPESISSIARGEFISHKSDETPIMLYVKSGSYAEAYAKENDIQFIIE